MATKVEIRFNVDEAEWIPKLLREKLKKCQENHINKKNELVIASMLTRTQVLKLKYLIKNI